METAIDFGEAMTLKEVAKLLGLSPWRVRQILVPSGLPHFRTSQHGKMIFYKSLVMQFMQKRLVQVHTKGGRL